MPISSSGRSGMLLLAALVECWLRVVRIRHVEPQAFRVSVMPQAIRKGTVDLHLYTTLTNLAANGR